MKKSALLITILLVSLANAYGQDTRFSQYTNTPLLINPGLTGMGNGFSRANLNYRSQWTTSTNSFSTSAISIDFPIYSKKMKWKKGYLGTGILFYKDQAGSGTISTNQASLALSSVIFTGKKSKISLGILGGYIQKSTNPDAIRWDSQYNGIQYDPTLPSQENFASSSAGNLDFSAGISYKFSSSQVAMNSTGNGNNVLFEMGIAGFHLIGSNMVYLQNQSAPISRRFVGHIRFLKSINESPIAIGFSALKMQQVSIKETTVGIEARYNIKGSTKYTGFLKDAYLGAQLLYRHQDAIVPVLSYKFNNWKISASYDYNTSKFSAVTGNVGGFEISIQFNDIEGELFNQGDKYVNYQGGGGNL
jgi:type IX secretion system PorP/SprF family membrane protein